MIGFTQQLRAHPTKTQLVVTPKAEASLKAEKQQLQTPRCLSHDVYRMIIIRNFSTK